MEDLDCTEGAGNALCEDAADVPLSRDRGGPNREGNRLFGRELGEPGPGRCDGAGSLLA